MTGVCVVHVHAIWRCVDLQGDTCAHCGIDYSLHVYWERISAAEQAAGGVAEDFQMRVFKRAKHSGRHCCFVLLVANMDGADNDVETRQQIVVTVQGTVCEDVGFNSG